MNIVILSLENVWSRIQVTAIRATAIIKDLKRFNAITEQGLYEIPLNNDEKRLKET